MACSYRRRDRFFEAQIAQRADELREKREREQIAEILRELQDELTPVVRSHRSAIVNIDFVREIHRDGRTEGWVVLASGERVRMNRTGWQKLLAMSGIS